MQKKILLMLIIFLSCINTVTYAAGVNADEIIKTQLEVFNWDEIKRLENDLKEEVTALKDFNLEEEVLLVVSGKKEFSIETIVDATIEMFVGELDTYINMMARFVLIIVLCHVLSNLSSAFESKNTTKIAFFVCYIVILYSVAQGLVLMVELAQNTIGNLLNIMYVVLPTLLTFMATSGYIATSAALSPVIIGGLTFISFVIQKFMLSSVVGVILLQIISSMSEEFKIDNLIALFYKICRWILRSTFFLSIGIMGIYRMSLPYTDATMKRVGITLSTKFIPILGDAVSGAIDLIIQCAGMIKSAFGIGVIIWIIVLITMPFIKMLVYIILYNFAAALVEPLGDKKMAKIALNIANGCEFIMSCVGVVAILCISALVICMSIGSSLL
ncbi:hypothetical protein AN640_04895 [Candidatus Epulonipiscium fishelsonii]|uniref:Uncharacterized protein n=1 Tax=Candidatus Epulonipiscium fishelsonii TaxID=77094 RepID=A0ACC8XIN6_9FIRM|nr:hypothetical protein AN640_04895 [Epulopiscium sp. SCG-D08WGA-EpuloA1]OON90518.1 MAG: hypothetical protein ATN32_03765 [Epulopiscium sp. AS2M-Bin002]